MLRHRRAVLAAWIVVFLAGGFASTKLPAILSNSFAVPGTDSEQVRNVLQDRFGDRSDGAFTLVFELKKGGGSTPAELRRARADGRGPPGGCGGSERVARGVQHRHHALRQHGRSATST